MATPLTDSEKERIRYHMGYMGTSFGGVSAAASLSYGIARPIQTMFLVENAIQQLLVNPFAVDRVRRVLQVLDELEAKLQAASCTLVAGQLGDLQLHPGKDRGEYFTDLLEREYKRWAMRLADILGCPLYKFSTRFGGGGGHGSGRVGNVRVSG